MLARTSKFRSFTYERRNGLEQISSTKVVGCGRAPHPTVAYREPPGVVESANLANIEAVALIIVLRVGKLQCILAGPPPLLLPNLDPAQPQVVPFDADVGIPPAVHTRPRFVGRGLIA